MDVTQGSRTKYRGLILLLGLLLALPAWLNITFGDSLGVWWAPFPFWIFLLVAVGVPPVVAALVPTVIFLSLAIPLHTGSRTVELIAALCVGAAWLSQLAWAAYVFNYGVEYYGLIYTCVVLGLGTVVLVTSTALYGVWRQRRDPKILVLSTWVVALWLAWYAVPWLGEAI